LGALRSCRTDLLASDENVAIVKNTKSPIQSRAQQVSTTGILEFAASSLRTFRRTEDANPLVATSTNTCPFMA
jgi:hypothetical protein